MKYVSCIFAFVLVATSGCAISKYGEFEPKKVSSAPAQPGAYWKYGPAMSHVDGYEMAYEWQCHDPKAVASATEPKALAAFVKDMASADALLARIGTAYDGDPTTLTQIAAVSQYVMDPKGGADESARYTWVTALERRRASTDDGYVRTFCDQQLRLCGFAK